MIFHLWERVLDLPLWWSQFLVLGGFGLIGTTKLIPFQQRELSSKFPFLPQWLWLLVGAWEISIPIVYFFLDQKAMAMELSFVVIGGIFYAVFATTSKFPRSHVRQSYGLMLFPGLVFALASVLICLHDGHSLKVAPFSLSIGALIGNLVTV